MHIKIVAITMDEKIFPEHQIAYIGSRTEISCFSDIEPKWVKDKMDVAPTMYSFNFILFKDVSEKDSGDYICGGRNFEGFFFAASTLLVAGREKYSNYINANTKALKKVQYGNRCYFIQTAV